MEMATMDDMTGNLGMTHIPLPLGHSWKDKPHFGFKEGTVGIKVCPVT